MPISSARHERMVYGDIKLYSGTAHPDLADEVAEYLGVKLCERDVVQFPNDNLFIKLHKIGRASCRERV